jgi:hypothetical protein
LPFEIGVARWFLFRPKIPIWEYYGMENVVAYSGQMEYIFYNHWVYIIL